MIVTEQDNYPDYYEQGMPGYVLRDWEVIDYECFELNETGLWFRGPAPGKLRTGEYFSVIGAAQTFGCFCPRPYPALIEEQLGLKALNLGYSGAGPSFFLQHPKLIDYVNRSAFCIIQVMSGRSVSNSFLENPEGLAYGRKTSDGKIASAETVFKDLLKSEKNRIRKWVPIRRLEQLVIRFFPPSSLQQFVKESREHWLESYHELMSAIRVPIVLFWFSERTPSYKLKYDYHHGVFNDFPHLVNAPMMSRVKRDAGYFVSSVSSRGLPQLLTSRFTGEPVTIDLSDDKPLYQGTFKKNTYYPSPEMQEDAADALTPVCKRILAEQA